MARNAANACAMAEVVSHRRPRFEFGSIYVGFLVDKVSLGQVLLREFDFILSISFQCGPPRSHITWGMNTRSVGSCSSETLCHPIDMNNTDANLFFPVVLSVHYTNDFDISHVDLT
jgi:hypothetical protein